ncbi:MAG: 23S rRNA (uracil(1939)-C(5))-methyltransferase RlmD, partial [Novibacillus thermophilus]
QLKQKTEHVKSALQKEGLDSGVVRDIIGMDDPWHYRHKMEFTFAPDGSLGLHEQGNYRNVIPLETCLIASRDIADGAMLVAEWAKEHGLKGYDKDVHRGLLRHLMVRQSSATGEMMLALFATEAPIGSLEGPAADLVERIQKRLPQARSVLWMENTQWADRAQAEQTHVLDGRDFIYDELAGFRYRLWYDTFFQVNPVQAEKLIELALEFGKPRKADTVIDLFCGVGTFSLPFARRVETLAGVEIVEKSVESARRNARDNGIDNATFLAADARRGIDRVLERFGRPDLLLLDPPRSGAGGKVMRKIGRAKPKRIVYVSCNPDTLASDIAQLAQFGYTLHTVQPVDMFPHTVHVETVVLITRV